MLAGPRLLSILPGLMMAARYHDPSHKLSVAPMMDRTDRHFRYLVRLIAPHVRLYTEMLTAEAAVRGDVDRLMAFHPDEQPLALQLGGGRPETLHAATRLAVAAGFVEVNLNCGCPSDRVTDGHFGACLMLEPALIADCLAAMRAAAGSVPVTIKTRIGVDDRDSYEHLTDLVNRVLAVGVDILIVHARKAWLSGLSPKENREIPPLRYEVVYQLKHDFPEALWVLNGGLVDLAGVNEALTHVDGAMIGRQAYTDPWFMAEAEAVAFASIATAPALNRERVLARYADYAEAEFGRGTSSRALLRHLTGMYRGTTGSRAWRRTLADAMQGAISPAQAMQLARLAAETSAPSSMSTAPALAFEETTRVHA